MRAEPIHEVGWLGIVLIGLFLLGWGMQRWRLPALLGFMAAGFLLQYLPIPILLAPVFPITGEIALWLLFFFIGLEYSPENLRTLSRNIALPGLIDFGISWGIPVLLSLALTSFQEALLLGSALYPSSTAIIARLLLDYSRLASAEAELLLGLLIFEDIVGIGLLGVLTPLSQGEKVSLTWLLRSLGSLGGTIIGFWLLYRWVIPWLLQRKLPVEEVPFAVLLMLGVVLAIGALGHAVGISGALFSFLLGVLIPQESVLFQMAEKSLAPLRELSMGLFFFALSYDISLANLPILSGLGWMSLAILTKAVATYWAARVWGLRSRTAFRAALSFIPRGEFSLVFGNLSTAWKGSVLLMVLGTTAIGTAFFAWAEELTRRLFPRQASSIFRKRPLSN
ncbi:MAG: cation:proton antiporter [Bacteroidia bacterium]|nr:cation:proton antiporter [Bacteroidia bacterium]MDW8236185.1 cation:proton antiporter [Bacteroidia bacterium]